MTFPPRFEFRAPPFFFDLRLVTAKLAADYADFSKQKQERIVDGEARNANPPRTIVILSGAKDL